MKGVEILRLLLQNILIVITKFEEVNDLAQKTKLTQGQQRIARLIFNVGAIKFGAFEIRLHQTQPGAPLSPIYINLRTPDNKEGPLMLPLVKEICEEFFIFIEAVLVVGFDLIAGIPRAGEPFAKVVSRLSRKPLITLGKKVEGDRRKIDSVVAGEYSPGQRVLLIDDLVTQADTKKEAIKACEEAGLRVVGIVVLVDREQGGSEELRRMGYGVYSVFTLSELLDFYVSEGSISSETRDRVLRYIVENR